MRILVLTYEFPPVGGGGGRVAQDLCRGFVQRGHAVRVLTAHMKNLAHQETLDGIDVIRIPSFRRLPYKADLLAMGGYVLAALPVALRHARLWQPDLLHVHFAVPSGPVALLTSRLAKIPYVLTAHLGDVPGGVPEKTGRWFRWLYPFTPPIWRSASRVVAVSQFTSQLARQHYGINAEVLPNGVDLSQVDPGEIQIDKPPRLIFAGRFMPQKNLLQLVHVLALVTDLEWTCKLLGDGPQRPEVEAEIQRLGLQERIQLSGWVTPEQVIDGFRESDILCMPSLSEGFPVVGVQGIAMGLAVLGSRVGGLIDLVEDGVNGFLFEPRDTSGMAGALRSFLTNPQALLQARQASRVRAARFDILRIVDRYEAIFFEIISGRK